MLHPNNKQSTRMFETADVSRFAYNWALEQEINTYRSEGTIKHDSELRKSFTELKKHGDFDWMYSYSNNSSKQAIKDAYSSFKNFLSGKSKFPKFKSKRKAKPSFYVDPSKIKFTETHVKLESIATSSRKNHKNMNWLRLAEHNRIPLKAKYLNPRVTFDGVHWWISVGIETETKSSFKFNDGIGIDLGIKDLAICSDKITYCNINKSTKIKKLEKRKRRLQRKVSKKYLKNKKGVRYCKTSNIIKSERELLNVSRKIKNIRHNYIHSVTSEIVNREPKFIVIEDLNVLGMMKNKHLSKSVQNQMFREFRRIIEYKCKKHNVKLIVADRWFASSKTCSNCGKIKQNLTLRDRLFICDFCGFTVDRDIQAAINLKIYGDKLV